MFSDFLFSDGMTLRGKITRCVLEIHASLRKRARDGGEILIFLWKRGVFLRAGLLLVF